MDICNTPIDCWVSTRDVLVWTPCLASEEKSYRVYAIPPRVVVAEDSETIDAESLSRLSGIAKVPA